MTYHQALDEYRQVGKGTGATYADPHQLLQLLYDGALDRLAQAQGALEEGLGRWRMVYSSKKMMARAEDRALIVERQEEKRKVRRSANSAAKPGDGSWSMLNESDD